MKLVLGAVLHHPTNRVQRMNSAVYSSALGALGAHLKPSDMPSWPGSEHYSHSSIVKLILSLILCTIGTVIASTCLGHACVASGALMGH